MLAKTIIGKEDILTRHISEHRIRPMQHGSFNENQLMGPKIQGIPRLYIDKIPVLMIKTAQDGFSLLRAVNRRIRNFCHQGRQGTAVIVLIMVHDDIVNLVKINFLF